MNCYVQKLLLKLTLVLSIIVVSQSSIAAATSSVNFVLNDTAGIKHQLSNYKGKWVLVNCWATWCPPCLEEVPDLVSLFDQREKKTS